MQWSSIMWPCSMVSTPVSRQGGDLGRANRMRGHPLADSVRLLDHRLHLLARVLLVEVPAPQVDAAGRHHLDDVRARAQVLAHRAPDLVPSVESRAVSVAVRGVDGAGREQEARAGDGAVLDRPPDRDVVKVLLPEYAHRGDAGAEIPPDVAACLQGEVARGGCLSGIDESLAGLAKMVWASMRPGSTVCSSSSITSASGGTETAPSGPAATTRSPSTSTTPFSMSSPSVPSKRWRHLNAIIPESCRFESCPPSRRVRGVEAGNVPCDVVEPTTSARKACMSNSATSCDARKRSATHSRGITTRKL